MKLGGGRVRDGMRGRAEVMEKMAAMSSVTLCEQNFFKLGRGREGGGRREGERGRGRTEMMEKTAATLSLTLCVDRTS